MIRLAIRRPVTVAMAYLAVGLLGVAAWRNIPIELLPDTRLPRLIVTAEWFGASPEALEAFVTAPIEAAAQQVRGVEKITSRSEEQYGAARATVEIEFARGTDMDFARLDLSERLAALEPDLPVGLSGPRITQYVPEAFAQQSRPFLSYTVTGPHTLEALRAHVDEVIVPALSQVDGVGEIEVRGGRARVLEIELDENKLHSLGLDPWRVRQRIEELEYVREAGLVSDRWTVRTVAIRHRPESVDEVRRAVLLSDGGRLVRLGDIAVVRDTYEEPTSYYRIDGQPAVSFVVHREPRTNAVAVADRVKAELARLEGAHPPGVRLILDEDESAAIRAQLTDLRYRALVSAAVIFAVLLLFLRSFRAAGIVFATIVFSILIALNLVYFGGFTLNVLTLMGLAMGFGLVVDNAIVVLENVYRRWREGSESDPAESAAVGAREVVLAVLASTCTTLVVFIPFVYLQGELQAYYVPLAVVVGMSLLASLLVAFTFIPSLSARLLALRVGSGSSPPAPGGPRRRRALPLVLYSSLLRFTLRHPWLTLAVAVGLFAGSYHLFDRYVTRGVVWRSWWADRTYIDIYIRLPRGEELERTDELVRFFEEKLKQLPEVERFVSRVQPQYASIRVTFPDSLENTWVPVAIKEQMVAYSYLFAGAEVRVYGYGPSFYGGGGAPPNYSIRIFGYNYEKVREIAEDLGRRLRRFSRIRDVDVNSAGWFTRDKASEFVLEIDRRRLALHGLTARDVVRQVGAAVRGRYGNDLVRIGGEELRYAVKLAGHDRMDVLELEELMLISPAGEGVRLADVAELKEREVLTAIVRENQQYRRVVSYEFRGPVRLGDRVRDAVVAATALPDGYRIEKEQEWRWSREEERQIYGVLAVALVLVFMVTAALFESLRQPFVVFLTVPMALIGVFLVFYLAQASFTREAYIGVIMMGGIVVNNAILLVDRVNQLRRVEGLGLREAIVRGAAQRVRPIFMTSATTIFGLLPLVLFSEYADSNIWNALGYALIGGLSSSTVLVLTVTPALYWLLERGPERRRLLVLGASEEELALLSRRRVKELLAGAVRGVRFLGSAIVRSARWAHSLVARRVARRSGFR
ncbi:Multidrug resistance protein MdtC [bacterium HR33]|nr:Multidrug resistance protein MdtC [bacterium HR33]